ncbi:hypothetical protein JCM5353_008014 [Sporobolomyces roseus]
MTLLEREVLLRRINFNDILRIGKKLFTFYKKWSKKQQQKQHAQQQQQQNQGYHSQAQPNYSQNQNQSPYPPPAVGHAGGQQQQNAWNNHQGYQQQPQQQTHYGGGGYGAHDGKPTKLTQFPLSPRYSPHYTSRIFSTFLLSPFANAYRIPQSTILPSLSTFRYFSSTSPPYRRPGQPISDPTSSFPPPSHRRPLLPALPSDELPPTSSSPTSDPSSSSDPSPSPPELKISIFHLLPQFLRPSYEILLRMNDDILVHFDEIYAEEQNFDMSNAQNAEYVELRNKAIREGDLMAKAFSDSQAAYTSGNGEAAHELSTAGKRHQQLKEQYNDQAAEWIYRENNRVQPPGSIDLHGLYVQESIEFTEKAIDNARNQGLNELRVIVGKGNHSPSHVAKLKPAITSLMQRKHLTAQLDPHNAGVIVVQLQRQGAQGAREMRGGEDVVREMGQRDDGGCVVM